MYDSVFRTRKATVVMPRDDEDNICGVYIGQPGSDFDSPEWAEVVSWTREEWGDILALSATLNCIGIALTEGVKALEDSLGR